MRFPAFLYGLESSPLRRRTIENPLDLPQERQRRLRSDFVSETVRPIVLASGPERVLPQQFIKRIGKGAQDDIAAVVAFLASDAAGAITGQVIDATNGNRL